MKTITATEARENLYKLLDETASSHEPLQITGKRTNDVLISEADWRAKVPSKIDGTARNWAARPELPPHLQQASFPGYLKSCFSRITALIIDKDRRPPAWRCRIGGRRLFSTFCSF